MQAKASEISVNTQETENVDVSANIQPVNLPISNNAESHHLDNIVNVSVDSDESITTPKDVTTEESSQSTNGSTDLSQSNLVHLDAKNVVT